MEIERETAQPVAIKKTVEKDFFLPLYQSDMYGAGDKQWFSGCLYDNEKDALSSQVHDRMVTRLKIFRIVLPVQIVPDSIDV